MHYENQANIVFYVLAGIATLILLMGLVGMIHIWRLGKAPTLNTDIKVPKWLGAILKASILETQILEYRRTRLAGTYHDFMGVCFAPIVNFLPFRPQLGGSIHFFIFPVF